MAEYIDREAVINAFEWEDGDVHEEFADEYFEFGFSRPLIRSIIGKISTADVAPVVHGRWENTSSMYGVISGRCSMCGLASGMWHVNQPYKYCPYCGARMDGDKQ